MHIRTRVVLSALSAALMLAFAVAGASANELAASEDQFDVRWTSASPLGFIPSAGSVVRCPVTLLGSFHTRTIAKVEHSLIGHIDHVVVRGGSGAGECTGGTATALTADLPWHVTYEGFTGELPDIATIRLLLIGARFEIINSLGINCLATTTTANPAAGDVDIVGGQATSLTADSELPIPAPGGDALCALFGVEGSFEGTGEVENRRGGLLFIELV